MVMINQDLSNVQPIGSNSVPKGDYVVQNTRTQEYSSDNSAGVRMTWTIVEGPYADSELTDVIVLDGSSQAVTFGKRKLRTIAIAVGHQNPSYVKDTDEFMNIPCIVKVGFGKPGTSYEDVSQIYQYLPLSSRPAVNTMGGSVAVPPKTNKVPPPGTQRAPVAPPQRAVPPNGGRVPPPTNGYKPQAGKKEFMDKGVPDVPEYGEEQSPDNPPF